MQTEQVEWSEDAEKPDPTGPLDDTVEWHGIPDDGETAKRLRAIENRALSSGATTVQPNEMMDGVTTPFDWSGMAPQQPAEIPEAPARSPAEVEKLRGMAQNPAFFGAGGGLPKDFGGEPMMTGQQASGAFGDPFGGSNEVVNILREIKNQMQAIVDKMPEGSVYSR